MRTVARIVFLLLLPFSLVATAMAAANHVPETYAKVHEEPIHRASSINECHTSIFGGQFHITGSNGVPKGSFRKGETVYLKGWGFAPYSCFRYEVRKRIWFFGWWYELTKYRGAIDVGSGIFFLPIWSIPNHAHGSYKVYFWDGTRQIKAEIDVK